MQDISRRAMMGGAAGAAALVAIGPDVADADAAPPVLRSHYVPSVGKGFRAFAGGRTHRVTLSAIRDAVPARPGDEQYSFTLVFSPARGTRLQDGIYELSRSGVHTRSLLLTSVGTTGRVQAVVNRTVR